MTILQRIVETKRREVEASKRTRPLSLVQTEVESVEMPRNFYRAIISTDPKQVALIAEIKKASPSAGLIRSDFAPDDVAQAYERGGATALSVLTDEAYFQGHLDFIQRVKKVVSLPVLRKDFIVDEYQVWESRAAGADAILLISEVLSVAQISACKSLAERLSMSVLVEVHSEENLTEVLGSLGSPRKEKYLLGINNRDLDRQVTDLQTMATLADQLPEGASFVAESGIRSAADVHQARLAGACAILVGEALLRQDDLSEAVRTLMNQE